jgi:membrane protease YdiL (CAAX protease family)
MPDAALCFVAGFFAANVAVLIATGAGADVNSLAVTAAGLIGLWVGLGVTMLAVTRAKGSGDLAVDFGLRFQRPFDLVGLPIGAGVQLLVVPLIYLPLSRFISDLGDRLEEPARELTKQATHGIGVAVLGVLVVVGAPIVEELFYRGLLLRAVQRRFGSNIAIGVSALVFAGAHFELLQFPALFALGVLLGAMAVRYERLGPNIFAHAGFNAVTMAILIATR